jgi:hypothetical protein
MYLLGMANVAHIRGTFCGGIILTVFGSFWSIIALSFLQSKPVWGIPAASPAMVV